MDVFLHEGLPGPCKTGLEHAFRFLQLDEIETKHCPTNKKHYEVRKGYFQFSLLSQLKIKRDYQTSNREVTAGS